MAVRARRWVFGMAVVVAIGGCPTVTVPFHEAHPEATWLRIEGMLARSRPVVVVIVDGTPAIALLDTGAQTTVLSTATAKALGLMSLVEPIDSDDVIVDAHGASATTWSGVLPPMMLGAIELKDRPVQVIASDQPAFLIGYDILQDFDLVFIGDMGLVGLFAPGTAPKLGRRVLLTMGEGAPSLNVIASASGADGIASATLVVDTGAEITTFPAGPAMMARVATDMRFGSVSRGVASSKQEPGHYVFDPLLLVGDVDVGRVVALESLTSGLLGFDVLRRFHTTITSPKSGDTAMYLAPMPDARRTIDAVDGRCAADIEPVKSGAPCVQARLERLAAASGGDNDSRKLKGRLRALATLQMGISPEGTVVERNSEVCLNITIRSDVARRQVELVLRELHPAGSLGGSRIGVVVTATGGVRECVALPAVTEVLGLSSPGPLIIEAIRTDGDVPPGLCPTSVCVFALGTTVNGERSGSGDSAAF